MMDWKANFEHFLWIFMYTHTRTYIHAWALSQICLHFLLTCFWLSDLWFVFCQICDLFDHNLSLCYVALNTTTRHPLLLLNTSYEQEFPTYLLKVDSVFSTQDLSVKKNAPLAEFLTVFSSLWEPWPCCKNVLTPVANLFLCSRLIDMLLGTFGYLPFCYGAKEWKEEMKIIFHTPI